MVNRASSQTARWYVGGYEEKPGDVINSDAAEHGALMEFCMSGNSCQLFLCAEGKSCRRMFGNIQVNVNVKRERQLSEECNVPQTGMTKNLIPGELHEDVTHAWCSSKNIVVGIFW